LKDFRNQASIFSLIQEVDISVDIFTRRKEMNE